MPAAPQLRLNSVTEKPETNCRGAHVYFDVWFYLSFLSFPVACPLAARAGNCPGARPDRRRRLKRQPGDQAEAAGDDLLRRRPRQRAVAEEPRDGGQERRAFHLFPLLHLPDEQGDEEGLSGA